MQRSGLSIERCRTPNGAGVQAMQSKLVVMRIRRVCSSWQGIPKSCTRCWSSRSHVVFWGVRNEQIWFCCIRYKSWVFLPMKMYFSDLLRRGLNSSRTNKDYAQMFMTYRSWCCHRFGLVTSTFQTTQIPRLANGGSTKRSHSSKLSTTMHYGL